ncbi:MAG: hypothetical protein LBT66_05360 [Methanobrevibacter sp.]|jgi:hypothetical protein|nr:hypothetical protein [Candidatus Methanovirga meridionalis]
MTSEIITFASYSIKIKDKKDEDKKLSLDKLYKKGLEENMNDLLDVLISFFNANELTIDKKLAISEKKEINKKIYFSIKKKIVSLEHFRNDNRIIYGVFNYGSFGKETKVMSLNNFNEEIIGEGKALLQPFYFLFYIPKDRERGILILERRGNNGIKTTLDEWLEKDLFSEDKVLYGYRPKIKGFLPKNDWEKLIDSATVTSFEFEEVSGLPDKTDYINNEFEGIKGTATVKINVNKKESKANIKKLFTNIISKNHDQTNGFIEFEEKRITNLRVKMKINGKERTYSADGESISPHMDIEVSENDFEKGYPKFEIIHQKAIEHKDYLKKFMEN